MKEELQGKLVEILTSIQTAAGKASDFALSQLPDIAQSYVMYGRISSLVGVLIGLCVIGAVAWLGWKLLQLNMKCTPDNEPFGLNLFGGFGLVASGVIGAVLFVSSLDNAMLVWASPKVWLLKELAHMVR